MRNLRHLSVISARENLVSNALYFLINKLCIVKWIAMFAGKKSTIRLNSKDIRLLCMVLFPLVHFIVKIVHYFFEVKKIWDIILPTNINWYPKSLQFICENFNYPGKADVVYLSTNIPICWLKQIFSHSIKYIFKPFLSQKNLSYFSYFQRCFQTHGMLTV